MEYNQNAGNRNGRSCPQLSCSYEDMKEESVVDSTDYTGVEPRSCLNRSENTEERKTGYGISREEKYILFNVKEEEEKCVSVKMESEDGVKDEEGLWREEEKERVKQESDLNNQTVQTAKKEKNEVKSECGQQEGELSTLVISSLQNQPRVLIRRLEFTNISFPVSSPPHSLSNKRDQGTRFPRRRHELSPVRMRSQGQKGHVVTQKTKMISQLERPLKPSSMNGEPNRHIMLCPVCHKPQDILSAHLRRVCMKRETPEAISAALNKAKVDTREHLKTGMVWSYGLICSIMGDANPVSRMVEELQRRHNVVTNLPPQLPYANVTGRPSSSTPPQPAETAAPETGESEQSDHASVSSGEMFQCEQENKWSTMTRKLMAEKGLYRKHSLDHPVLKGFGTHLEKDLQNEHYKQEVENVARFLYFMDPQQPSLEFVRDREKSKLFFRQLTEAKLSKQTVQNYHKSLKRFLVYHTHSTNLRHEDATLHGDCRHFIDYIGVQQKCLSKQVSKEITQKRHDRLIEKDPLTPHDCLAVLKAARRDFLGVMEKACVKDSVLELTECGFVLYYLEAVLILKHLQQPGVVEHMTVKEWDSRVSVQSGHCIVGVKEHKTAAQQVAVFALSDEEEMWFLIYYMHVRPQVIKAQSKKRKRDEAEEESEGEAEKEERFFISTTGRPIYNASNDLNRLQAKYKVVPVTSQLARRVFETATKSMSDAEKSLVADYLTHSTVTAEKHYRMKQSGSIVRASQLLAQLAGDTSDDGSPDGDSGPTASGSARNRSQERDRGWIYKKPMTGS
ncbi:hypothetical protein AAFF_G00324220 [Aldrovandia affinis]|uniref:Uncharacterized protein n=1 Tax=Aldrovandia affinis TaxID=143900 RepID=A0AAD7W098_9TELE|nr:hypothetical protein AAFF_G00324220 [Aldrovandia affinis]